MNTAIRSADELKLDVAAFDRKISRLRRWLTAKHDEMHVAKTAYTAAVDRNDQADAVQAATHRFAAANTAIKAAVSDLERLEAVRLESQHALDAELAREGAVRRQATYPAVVGLLTPEGLSNALRRVCKAPHGDFVGAGNCGVIVSTDDPVALDALKHHVLSIAEDPAAVLNVVQRIPYSIPLAVRG